MFSRGSKVGVGDVALTKEGFQSPAVEPAQRLMSEVARRFRELLCQGFAPPNRLVQVRHCRIATGRYTAERSCMLGAGLAMV